MSPVGTTESRERGREVTAGGIAFPWRSPSGLQYTMGSKSLLRELRKVELLPWMPCRLMSVQLTTESLEEPWQGPELESLAGPSAR